MKITSMKLFLTLLGLTMLVSSCANAKKNGCETIA